MFHHCFVVHVGVVATWMMLQVTVHADDTVSHTFTPDSLTASFGEVTNLRTDIDTSNGIWEVDGSTDLSPITMALRTTMYSGTDCSINNFNIHYDAGHTSSEGDAAIIVSAGSEYVSFMFDYDGGVYVSSSITGGVSIYPACGSTILPTIANDSSDPSDLFDDNTDTNSGLDTSFYNWRDRMAGGNRDSWTVMSSTRVSNQAGGFDFGFSMDATANTMTISFSAGSYSTSCSMNTIFSFTYGDDIIVDFSPDYHTGEYWYINSITATSDCSAGTNGPSPPPTSFPTTSLPTESPTECGVGDMCPVACDTDPCECDTSIVGECVMTTCHINGCDQCESGYFKKDYDYPCTSCNNTFGPDCMHCTDFLGCQQCSIGIRTFDQICGLYFCDDGSCGSGSDTGGTISGEGVTPNPTRSPTEEPTEIEDEISCTDGYFTIEEADAQFSDIIGTYEETDMIGTDGYPIYESEYGAIAYKGDDTVATTSDIYYIETFSEEYIFIYSGASSINDLAGTNEWEGYEQPHDEEDLDAMYTVSITITVFDCDGNAVIVTDDMTDYQHGSTNGGVSRMMMMAYKQVSFSLFVLLLIGFVMI